MKPLTGGGIWLDGYEPIVVSTRRTGEQPRHPDSPPRIILHTTEGRHTYDYPFPPHFTLGLVGDPDSLPAGDYWLPGVGNRTYRTGDQLRHQHCDLNLTSYALLHRSGDPETNHEGSHCVQVEIISMAADPPGWSDAMYGLVASWLADVITALPELKPCLDNYPAVWSARGSYGFDTPYRVSWNTWKNGLNQQPTLWGHQHVPGNSHWDPGALDAVKLSRMAKTILGAVPPEQPGWKWRVVKRLNAHDEKLAALDQRIRRLE